MTNQEFIESIRLEGEEWRDVVGWEGYYMVSSFGRVATMYREYVRSDGVLHHTEQKLIRGDVVHYTNTVRYNIFTFRKGGKRYHMAGHRLVAMAFIPNPDGYPNVDHIDTNGLNNRVENLRWCTQAMNLSNPISKRRSLLASSARIGVPNVPLEKKVAQIKCGRLVRIFVSLAECERFGFHHSAVSRCCSGKKPQYKGYSWMYLPDYEKSCQ